MEQLLGLNGACLCVQKRPPRLCLDWVEAAEALQSLVVSNNISAPERYQGLWYARGLLMAEMHASGISGLQFAPEGLPPAYYEAEEVSAFATSVPDQKRMVVKAAEAYQVSSVRSLCTMMGIRRPEVLSCVLCFAQDSVLKDIDPLEQLDRAAALTALRQQHEQKFGWAPHPVPLLKNSVGNLGEETEDE